MRLTACITTLNRTQELDACLSSLWNSSVKPYSVIVSDNSPSSEVQQKNRHILSRYPDTTYLEGTHSSISSNRNNALSALTSETDLVTCLADDICVEPDFIERAVDRYTQMSAEEKEFTILSGDCTDKFTPNGRGPLGFSFRGFHCHSDPPQVVTLFATVFPKSLFDREKWDENIFIGQEDVEFSLRVLQKGYRICYCPDLKVVDICPGASTMPMGGKGPLTDYELYREAGRLYVGTKRYKHLFPNPLKLAAFTGIYFAHMTVYLLKRGSLSTLPEIIRRSNIKCL